VTNAGAAPALTALRPTLRVEHRAEVVIGARPSWLFEQLGDPCALVACVPGAILTRVVDAHHFEAHMRVGYAGQGTLVASGRTGRRILLSVQGTDAMARSQAHAQLFATVGEYAGGAIIRARLNVRLTGSAARFSHGLVGLVTRRLIEQTADRMRSRFEGRRG
jgi:carbon monoxide dehydrogenase subunit G